MANGTRIAESGSPPISNVVVEQATAFMHARTVSFWGHHDELTKGEPCLYGSGVLLQIAETKFIATAYHVCESFLQDGWSAFVGGGAEKLLQLDRASIRYSKKADVALLKVSESVGAAFSSEKRFARLSEVSGDDPTHESGGIYCAFGYPSLAAGTDHDAKLHTMVAEDCWGLPYPRTKRPIEDFDPKMHIAIEFDRHAHPRPPGMSGGGIWRVHQGGVPAAGWSANDVRLVAIEHTHGITDRALVGTRSGYLFALAKSLDPSLEPALALVWPSRTRILQERLVRDD